MPVSRRTGKRYAAGSQKKWSGWEPRVCAVCGKRVKLDGAGMHEFDDRTSGALSLCGADVGSYSHAKHAGAAS